LTYSDKPVQVSKQLGHIADLLEGLDYKREKLIFTGKHRYTAPLLYLEWGSLAAAAAQPW
jgi:hypothetical protein